MKYENLKEIELKMELDQLFSQWKKHLLEKGATQEEIASFVTDGFYPSYLCQKYKILFVGRESVGISGADYIELLYDAIKNNNIGGQTLNQHRVTNKCFYITYGLTHGIKDYNNLPWASEMIKDFCTDEGISYAFINLSKFSNELDSGHNHADWNSINRFIELSEGKENFLKKEIELLNPDVIITMNIGNYHSLFGDIKHIKSGNEVSISSLKIDGKEIPVIETYHFSCRKSVEKFFYKPIIEMVGKMN